jgi:hypothetical protein
MGSIGERTPYKDKDYTIFPSEEFLSPDQNSYLPELDQEYYVMAIGKGTENKPELIDLTNKSLQSLEVSGSELDRAQNELEEFEKKEAVLLKQIG